MVTLCDATLTLDRVSAHVLQDTAEVASDGDGDLNQRVSAMEIREIRRALAEAQGNKSKAAQELGISRFALNRKIEKYGIEAAG